MYLFMCMCEHDNYSLVTLASCSSHGALVFAGVPGRTASPPNIQLGFLGSF